VELTYKRTVFSLDIEWIASILMTANRSNLRQRMDDKSRDKSRKVFDGVHLLDVYI